MKLYYYDDNGYYSAMSEAFLDPLETELQGKEVWLIPPHATTIKPPSSVDGHIIKFNGKTWELEKMPDPDPDPEPEPELTLEDLKILKIKRLKIERDLREVDKIVYNDNIFDFDDKARERMRIARADLLFSNVSERLWTCADDKVVSLSVLDFDNINSLAATRAEQLHFQYRKLKIVVQQCETLEALEHINFDTDCSHVEVEVTNG